MPETTPEITRMLSSDLSLSGWIYFLGLSDKYPKALRFFLCLIVQNESVSHTGGRLSRKPETFSCFYESLFDPIILLQLLHALAQK